MEKQYCQLHDCAIMEDVAEIPQDIFEDRLHEECGVFGVSGRAGCAAASLSYMGLYALQHRGQESAGIAVSDGAKMACHKNMGMVRHVFDESVIAGLTGTSAIGHVRYSTTGASSVINAQPIAARCLKGMVAVAHNGNLINTAALCEELAQAGSVFQTTSDTEIILNLIARFSTESMEEAIRKTVSKLKGSFSLVVLHGNKVYAVRDANGNRPLSLGIVPQGYVVASESSAISSIGGEVLRDIDPGEMVILSPEGIRSQRVLEQSRRALCAMEFVYFSRADSVIDGRLVHETRKEMGRQLARVSQIEADLVVPVPESGFSTAIGYAEQSGLPLDIALVVNRYVGRTFIRPQQAQRNQGVNLKLHPISQVLKGKRIVIIDDSIVRGTTSKFLVKMLREAGAKEVHMFISSPPLKHPCFYGIDISASRELIAATCSIEEIRQSIGADSLHFQTIEGLRQSIGLPDGLCLACFNGEYPFGIPGGCGGKHILEGEQTCL
ncbi:MAG: amidophosphoribosyltransferase [Bacillota bacterium]|jgi:amidophosphoribosyltransferase